jgi:pyruvate/2-oxoglutarate dehydrogenase complex dihydrolipoamide dehydrogenase (E3) component
LEITNRLIVVGGGPAGREAAGWASRLGADVTLITRSLKPEGRLDAAAVRFLASEAPEISLAWAPEGPAPGPEYAPAMRESLIGALEIAGRNFENRIAELQAIGVRVVEGVGAISAADAVTAVLPEGKSEYFHGCSIILAVGSDAAPGVFAAESPRLLSPASIPSLSEVPQSLIILGSSTSALELARFFAAYNVFVTVVGARKPALDFLDRDLRAKVIERASDDGIRILADVTAVAGTADGLVDILLSDGSHADADLVLPCREGGYRTEGLGLEGPGVKLGPDGEILVDERMQTSVPSILAVGSATGRFTLNIAVAQARVAADNAMGGGPPVRYELIPTAVRFDPEIGAVGFTEEQACALGVSVTTAAVYYPLEPGPERWAKVVVDDSTGRLFGLHCVGEGAVEMAHLGALAMHAGITIGDVAEIACIEGTMAETLAAAASRARHPYPESVSPLISSPD